MSTKIKNSILILTCAICFTIIGYTVNRLVVAEDESVVEIGTPFELTRHTGESVSSESFRGSYMLIYFGFVHCPATCPITLNNITAVLRKLENTDPDKAEQVTPIFISVDPDRDTPEIIGQYISHFHERFEGMTGSNEELVDIVNAYGSYFSYDPPDEDGNYNVNHSSYIYLMGPKGRYLTHFNSDEDIDQILKGLIEHVS